MSEQNILNDLNEILNYLGDEDKSFWENCTCGAENFRFCTCEENKTHIFRAVENVRDWLNSPSCPLTEDEDI